MFVYLKIRSFCILSLFILPILSSYSAAAQQMDQPEGENGLRKTWKKFNLDSVCNSGLTVFDITNDRSLFEFRPNNFFIPASVTKILTLYAALHTLDDTLVAAYYQMHGDSLIVWGGGDPGTRYPNVESGSVLVDFIRYSQKNVYFSSRHFQTNRFGSGWAWDDHGYAYQCERNAFPLYGNRLWIDRVVDTVTIRPGYFSPLVMVERDSVTKLTRSEWGDQYFYHYDTLRLADHRIIPITYFKNDLRLTWSEATGKYISYCNTPLDPNAFVIKGSGRDSLLAIMMRESDNFIAEQLLLAASLKSFGVMNEKTIISGLLKGAMSFIEDTIQWVDGSGLSRYNLMSPAIQLAVLRKLYDEKGMTFISAVFNKGGLSNADPGWYLTKNKEAFVYAKSGTMRNVQNLSGYILTRKGNILAFSWMNNQCMTGRPYLASAMEKMITQLYEDY